MEVNGQIHDPAALPLAKKSPIPHWIGGCVGPRAGLDTVQKRKIMKFILSPNYSLDIW
jgi:hypothetical protein